MRKGDMVRLIQDATGDLPSRYMKRIGEIVGRRKNPDDGTTQFYVKFPGRIRPLTLFIDEIEKCA